MCENLRKIDLYALILQKFLQFFFRQVREHLGKFGGKLGKNGA